MNDSATIMNVSSARSATFSTRCTSGADIQRPRSARSQRGVDELGADSVAKFVPDRAHRGLPRFELLGRQHRELGLSRSDDALLVVLIDLLRARVAPLRHLG